MQTKHEIQELLTSAGVSPNRRLGQHFLVDLNLMRLLIDSAGIGREDMVLEIGAGTGSLTEDLAERAGQVVTVELDRTLACIVQSRLADAENVQIVEGDVLSGKGSLNPAVVEAVHGAGRGGRTLLVANLPYDVASSVMINLVRGPVVVDAMFVTIQREVAERMTASPGNRNYGTLSIFLQATGAVEIIRLLKPGVFWPPPNVDSAMVHYARETDKSDRIEDMDLFGAVVALFMGHRRKMLRACARQAPVELGGRDLWLDIFRRCSVDPTVRPEELSPRQYVDLANCCGRLIRTQ